MPQTNHEKAVAVEVARTVSLWVIASPSVRLTGIALDMPIVITAGVEDGRETGGLTMPRLIDADALLPFAWAEDVEYLIRSAPTIDAEPVQYGEFTTLDAVDIFITATPKRCQTCRSEFIVLFHSDEPNQGMFCPRCGARRRADCEM